MRKERGVHRGKIDSGRLALLDKTIKELGLNINGLRIEGSLAQGPKGARHTDIDISGSPPEGLSEEELRKIEEQIQDATGLDFYFR